MPFSVRSPRILVVDDDAPALAGTVQELGDDFTVRPATSADAFREAMEHAPDLMIVSVEAGTDGWGLVKRVRCRPERALVPCIFIAAASSAEDRLRGFQLGADDFVRRPLRPGELARRVHGCLQRQARIVGAVCHHLRTQDGIAGALEHVGLPALLALLEMERKTGVLLLQRRDPPHEARLHVRDGHVHDAQLGGRRPLSQAEAVYDLLRWHTGRFEFLAQPLDVPDAIGLSTAELLLEGARRIDDGAPALAL